MRQVNLGEAFVGSDKQRCRQQGQRTHKKLHSRWRARATHSHTTRWPGFVVFICMPRRQDYAALGRSTCAVMYVTIANPANNTATEQCPCRILPNHTAPQLACQACQLDSHLAP
eukprot:362478-Chlamydomonas_euryale.AAC.1